MVVLVALSAALYAAILIPFKVGIPFIPGFTELRPANVIPIVCSLLFGPAAAWGSAFGNLIGDFFGTLGPGSFFGFFGNFLYGYIPYKLWQRFTFGWTGSKREVALYLLVTLIASMACGVVIGWGVDALGLVPFAALGNIIFLNNFVVSAILGPFLLKTLYRRLSKWGLTYQEIMEERDLTSSRLSNLGIVLLFLGVFSGLLLGNLLSIGLYKSGILGFGFGKGGKGEIGITIGLLPSIILIFLGSLLL